MAMTAENLRVWKTQFAGDREEKHVTRTKALIGSPVIGTDGETGRVRTFLFDGQSWKVRYA